MAIPTSTLQLGSSGDDVTQLEGRLTELGFYSGPADGAFTDAVDAAVRAFQASAGLNADGVVGPRTWAALYPVDGSSLLNAPLAQRCMALTGSFETGAGFPDCFAGMTGDFDGQGLSFGVLQWNIGQGTLQPMFSEFLNSHPEVAASVFGDNVDALRTMLAASRADQLEWARGIQNTSTHRISQPWQGMLKALGLTPEFQAIEVEFAGAIQQAALDLCARFGVQTERALALMFDIRVQNGTISAETEALIRQDCAAIPEDAAPLDAELAMLRSIANRRAEAANPRFVEDVRTRKLVIANGAGVVHGISYDLERQFGIRLQAA